METVYKLLDASSSPGKLLSLGTSGLHEVQYAPGGVVTCPNMMVFDTLENAKAYSLSEYIPIWVCRTSQTYLAPPRILHAALVDDYYDDFWSAWKTGGIVGYLGLITFDTPHGTRLCNDLELIRQVYP